MEKPKLGHKAYKKIVPLKGSLLQKLKNEIKKELSKNDIVPNESKANDTSNDTKKKNQDTQLKSPSKPVDKKIIIQKVENVKIEMITTSSEGPMRRLSDLFTPALNQNFDDTPENVRPDDVPSNDVIPSEVDENLPVDVENKSNGTGPNQTSFTLLSTKIPANSCNQKVPLRMVRTLKPPKPKPNLKSRFHRVETFKTAEASAEPVSSDLTATETNREVEFKLLVPIIQMEDSGPLVALTANVEPVSQETTLEVTQEYLNTQPAKVASALQETRLLDQEKAENKTVFNMDFSQVSEMPSAEKQISDQEENLRGFPREENTCDHRLKLWYEILRTSRFDEQERIQACDSKPEVPTAETKELPVIDFAHKSSDKQAVQIEVKQRAKRNGIKTRVPAVKRAMKEPKKTKKIVKETQLDSATLKDNPTELVLPNIELAMNDHETVETPVEPALVINELTRDLAAAVDYRAKDISLSSQPTEKVEPMNEDPAEPTEGCRQRTDVEEQIKPEVPVPQGSPRKIIPKRHHSFIPAKSEAKEEDWKNDILSVLGINRIKAIDKKMKEIPNLVTGNAIETENVELKLVIRHLMRKFKVNSIMDTLGEESSNQDQTQDSSLDEDDDDYPDSLDDDSNGPNMFLDPSFKGNFDSSAFEDDDRFSNFSHDDVPGTSKAAGAMDNEGYELTKTLTSDDPDPITQPTEKELTQTTSPSPAPVSTAVSQYTEEGKSTNIQPTSKNQDTITQQSEEEALQSTSHSPDPVSLAATQHMHDGATVNIQPANVLFNNLKMEGGDKAALVKTEDQTNFTTAQIEEEESAILKTRKGKKRTLTKPVLSRKPRKKLKSEKVNSPAVITFEGSIEMTEKIEQEQLPMQVTMVQEDSPMSLEPEEVVEKKPVERLRHALEHESLRSSSQDSHADAGNEKKIAKPSRSVETEKKRSKFENRLNDDGGKRNSSRGSSCASRKELEPQKRLKVLSDHEAQKKSLISSSRDSSVESIKTSLLPNKRKTNARSQRPLKLKDANKKRTSLQKSSPEHEDKTPESFPKIKSEKSDKPAIIEETSLAGVVSGKAATKDESEGDSGPTKRRLRRGPLKRIQPMTDESNVDHSDLKEESSSDSEKPLSNLRSSGTARRNKGTSRMEKSSKIVKKKVTRKIIDSSSDSDQTSDNPETTARSLELKSRLNPIDSNSKRKSSIFIRNDYLKPTDRKSNVNAGVSQMLQKLTTMISAKKENDSNYAERPLIEKRERLRTSAFKGNDGECSNDKDNHTDSEPETRPSVSRESSADSAIVQTNSDKSHNSSLKKHRRSRKKPSSDETVVKREFKQESLKASIENLVPYDQIVESIITGIAPKLKGRVNKNVAIETERKKEVLKKELKTLEYFHCGSCSYKVTKHLWIDHFLKHGGIAWIEGFDAPIKLEDWNEALRRTIRHYKIYNLIVMTCPNCLTEKRSAISHLSHLLICAESEEVVEKRKLTCELCNEKYFPFTATLHKNKCPGYQKLQVNDEESDVESEEDKGEGIAGEILNLSGRTKRNAVKRAEKKFKKVLKSMDRPSDQLSVVKGHLTCRLCGLTEFDSEKDAIDHIKAEHNMQLDFEGGSDSEEDLQVDDGSIDETEGSSGVQSSELSSEEEILVENGDSFVSKRKAKPSSSEPQEVKNGRGLIMEYIESLRGQDIPTKTFKWTKQFADDNWKTEVFPQFLPKFTLTLNIEPKALLPSLQFTLKSLKFDVKQAKSYVPTYEIGFTESWKQLEIGESYNNMDSATFYCGGSVASLDWAPVSSAHKNFLAVACNSKQQGINVDLTESLKSSVQVYELQHLKNKSFEGFQNKTKLSYVIVIEDGPVWSIKFHPSESSAQKRIGLLAVTTADQRILIYSMPYLNSDKPSVLSLQPNLICKLQQDDVLLNDAFLLQALKLAWHHKSGLDSVLAAGFISGVVGVWNISSHEYSDKAETHIIYPHHVIQAHYEPVTALDFKTTEGTEFHLVTSSGDRKVKVFTFDEISYQEIASYYSTSRILCTEWWMHWPTYLFGIDDCFTFGQLTSRQPLEFGMRNLNLINTSSPTTDISINHWLNFAMFVTDSGDVIGCRPKQMLFSCPKDRWDYFKFNLYSYTDFNRITTNDVEEIGIVFGDFKHNLSQPKKFRLPPTERINELQINQVCFNRNEESCRFYALGYETGFFRVRYLKNSK